MVTTIVLIYTQAEVTLLTRFIKEETGDVSAIFESQHTLKHTQLNN